jgi:hypothetical protein
MTHFRRLDRSTSQVVDKAMKMEVECLMMQALSWPQARMEMHLH